MKGNSCEPPDKFLLDGIDIGGAYYRQSRPKQTTQTHLMKITSITVSAGRTFNHPTEQFSNLRSDVSQTATLEDGDDPEQCLRNLRADTEMKAEMHKQHLLREIQLLNELAEAERDLSYAAKKSEESERAAETVKELQQKIAELKGRPFMLQAAKSN